MAFGKKPSLSKLWIKKTPVEFNIYIFFHFSKFYLEISTLD